MTWMPCACGGVIVLGPRDSPETAVARHRQEARHLLYRLAMLDTLPARDDTLEMEKLPHG